MLILTEGQDTKPANADQDDTDDPVPTEKPKKPRVIGEGGETGDVLPGKSLVFATLEICLQVLVKQLPGLNPSLTAAGVHMPARKDDRLVDDTCQLVSGALQIMADLPLLCSPGGKTLKVSPVKKKSFRL